MAGVGLPVHARSKYGNVISSLVTPNTVQLQHNVRRLLDVIQPANISKFFTRCSNKATWIFE